MDATSFIGNVLVPTTLRTTSTTAFTSCGKPPRFTRRRDRLDHYSLMSPTMGIRAVEHFNADFVLAPDVKEKLHAFLQRKIFFSLKIQLYIYRTNRVHLAFYLFPTLRKVSLQSKIAHLEISHLTDFHTYVLPL